MATTTKGPKVPYRCCFCGKSQEQVRKLIAGQGVYICDECINLCQEIIDEEMLEAPARQGRRSPSCPTRRKIKYGPGPVRHQPGARQAGPLGRRLQPLQAGQRRHAGRRRRAPEEQHPAGRAHRLAARRCWPRPWPRVLDVPFCIADATALTEAGYVGEDVENILLRLIQAADFDVARAAARHHLHRRDRQDRAQGATTPRSPATSPARASSRRSSRSSRARSPTCRRRAAASIPTRTSSRSTRPTSCSSAAAPSRVSSGSSEERVGAKRSIGFGSRPRSDAQREKLLRAADAGRPPEVRPDPRVRRPPARHREHSTR